MKKVKIIGAGLAGCEAAYQAAKRGIKVELYEAKPIIRSAAHSSDTFCELVCSNSLKSDIMPTAGGLLKQELRLLDSLVLSCAEKTKVPAGGALAVERNAFSELVTQKIHSNKNIKIINQLVDDFDTDCEAATIIATGPLTLDPLADKIKNKLSGALYFYDAAAPIISGESINLSCAFTSSRYGKGGDDYINCPLNKEEYENFCNQLISAETVPLKNFEAIEVFEGCMPVEAMAKRGKDTLRFGPLRPVGFIDPSTGKRPYAVVQLRKENNFGTMYNIVGFQTNLKFGEQKRVFSMIPALKNAEFLRYGVMHRNTYINSPLVLNAYFQLKKAPNVFVAGQLSGVEGYVESIASGLMAGINAVNYILEKPFLALPAETIIGSLSEYLQTPNKNFQPINASFGILPPLCEHIRNKDERKNAYCTRSLQKLQQTLQSINLP